MADFSAVLKKTIDALAENTPAAREKIYQKARTTIEAKLAAITPPPAAAVVERQRKLLEDAIASVEAEHAEPEPEETFDGDELDRVFAELDPDPAPEPLKPAAPLAPPAMSAPAAKATPAGVAPAPGTPMSDEKASTAGTMSRPEDGDADARDEMIVGPEAEAAAPLAGSPRARRKGPSGLTVGIVLLVLAAVAAGAWFYRDDISRMANLESQPQAGQTPVAGDAQDDTLAEIATDTEPTQNATDGNEAGREPVAQRPAKFTQRLMPNGQEIDEGPADGEPGLGEGTSVAQATVPGSSDPAAGAATPPANAGSNGTAASAQQETLPVGQKAIFYEERTSSSDGSADPGAVVWSVVQESPGNDLPPEPAIRAEATIPAKGLQLKMTIRRNADESLPASHIVEIIFLTPSDFEGGGVDNVLRISMKRSEQDTGSPLLGIPARIADGYFLVALSDSRADIETNTLLLRRQSWIDIPVVYKSGRRALITIERGIPGDKIFTDVLNAWQNATSG
ncbi:hypothetical protein [Nitratireductor pacificus]|uniref:Uncharacterized protein n=1 Tax=Nitratireductor pacificus pht-3B TaxID=391937 RepID=K2MNC8_9HYPH|nr:hypothetical protein [Nitratireductor pacificus]EKF18792.1 hypothetical protein NA2_11430 [Nitratireductor pacificus pht-3B]